jgi:hypothetical protein
MAIAKKNNDLKVQRFEGRSRFTHEFSQEGRSQSRLTERD